MPPGQKGGPKGGSSRLLSGWFFYKDTPKAEGSGKPMVFYLSEGQRNEIVGFWPLSLVLNGSTSNLTCQLLKGIRQSAHT
jgi:hypothetical protein